MTTVGYGDVHAEGQLARALVCALIVFNVVVVASLVRAYTCAAGRDAEPLLQRGGQPHRVVDVRAAATGRCATPRG